MRDNGDGVSAGARLGQANPSFEILAKSLIFVDDRSNSFVLNGLREIFYKPLLTGQNKNRSLALGSE
jgi:hypothetical protein